MYALYLHVVCLHSYVCLRQTVLVSFVYEPGCLIEEACPGLKAAVQFARRQQSKQSVVGVAVVSDDPTGLTDTPIVVNVLDGGKLTSANAVS